jgi:enoyl-CoA hydratase/carnithine racemase
VAEPGGGARSGTVRPCLSGSSPSSASPTVWPWSRWTAPRPAKELILTGRQVRADEALRMGLVNRVVAPDDVLATALAWGAELAAGPLVAHALAKSAVDRGLEVTLAEGLVMEQEAFKAVVGTEDAARGLASFKEHGPGRATFVGR